MTPSEGIQALFNCLAEQNNFINGGFYPWKRLKMILNKVLMTWK